MEALKDFRLTEQISKYNQREKTKITKKRSELGRAEVLKYVMDPQTAG